MDVNLAGLLGMKYETTHRQTSQVFETCEVQQISRPAESFDGYKQPEYQHPYQNEHLGKMLAPRVTGP